MVGSLPSVMQFLLYRWRAELSCAAVMGDTEIYLDAIRKGLWRAGRDLARVDIHVYDLVPTRLGY